MLWDENSDLEKGQNNQRDTSLGIQHIGIPMQKMEKQFSVWYVRADGK